MEPVGGGYRFFDDVKALLVDLEPGHLLHDLLQQYVLLIVVTLHRQLWLENENASE